MRFWFAFRALPIATEIRVYPDLRRERAADLLRSRHLVGAHRRRQLGKGREFDKLREYEPGDSFEDIDWKATARRRLPVVKVFQIERTQEIYVAIDSSRLSARGNVLDSYVTAALALAVTAESQHDRFGLATFSAGVDNFVPAAGGKRHFAFCRDTIYALQPRSVTPDVQEIFSYLHTHLRKRSLVVFLTALDDPFLAESFLARYPRPLSPPSGDDQRPRSRARFVRSSPASSRKPPIRILLAARRTHAVGRSARASKNTRAPGRAAHHRESRRASPCSFPASTSTSNRGELL